MSGLTLSTVCSARPAGVWFLGLGKSSLHRVPSSGSADSVFVRGMVSEDSRAISQAPTTAGRLKLLALQSPYSRNQSLGEPHKLAAYGQRKSPELEPRRAHHRAQQVEPTARPPVPLRWTTQVPQPSVCSPAP